MSETMDQTWRDTDHTSKQFTCGFCNRDVASSEGYFAVESYLGTDGVQSTIQICPNCNNPSYFQRHTRQMPKPSFGSSVSHIPEVVEDIYEEARRCTSHGAYLRDL